MKPFRNPDCSKYKDDPDREWCGGGWLTKEAAEAKRERDRKRTAKKRLEPGKCSMRGCNREKKKYASGSYSLTCQECKRAIAARYEASEKGKEVQDKKNAKRVYVGRYYVGRAPTAEQAAALTNQVREAFA